jgi:hypothetical protein
MVNPSLGRVVDTLTPMRPMPLAVTTLPRTTAARLQPFSIQRQEIFFLNFVKSCKS